MKAIIAAIILYGLVVTNCVANELKKVVFHINEPEKIFLLLSTVKYLRENKKDFQVAVVVNGPAVLRLSKTFNYAKELIGNTYWVGACSVGMFNNKFAQKDLSEGVHFISESGIVALVNFQKDGYTYIKI